MKRVVPLRSDLHARMHSLIISRMCAMACPALQLKAGQAHLRRHWRYARWVVVLCKDDFGLRPRKDLDLEEWVRQHYSSFMAAEPRACWPSSAGCRTSITARTMRPGRGTPRTTPPVRHDEAPLGLRCFGK